MLSANNYNISYFIIYYFFLPKRIIDYVIAHELAHILVPNHSKKFWSTVEQIDPNYREKKDWLKVAEIENKFYTLSFMIPIIQT